MTKHFYWALTIIFSIIWLILSMRTEDEVKKEGCISRSVSFVAASFVILALPD